VIIGKPAHIFALPQVPPQAAGIPDQKPNPVPLKTVFSDGRQIDISALLANIGKQRMSNLYPVAGLPLATGSSPVAGALYQSMLKSRPVDFAPTLPVAPKEPSADEAPTITKRFTGAASWITGSHTLVSIPSAATQDQVADVLKSVFPAQQADGVAKAAVEFVHSQGGHAVIVGIVTGGFIAAILAFLGYKENIVATAITGGLLTTIAVLFFGHASNPFIGKWTLNEMDSHYQIGRPPRQEAYEIAEEGNSLKISRTSIQEDGKRQETTYRVDPDGKQHSTVENGADSMTTTLAGTRLTTSYSKRGEVIETEARSLSADQKRMTVSIIARTPSGQPYSNVAVYDRK
jgi:hypothetical protein